MRDPIGTAFTREERIMTTKCEEKVRTLSEQELATVSGGLRRRLASTVSPGKGATQVYVDDGVNLVTNNPAANNGEVNWY